MRLTTTNDASHHDQWSFHHGQRSFHHGQRSSTLAAQPPSPVVRCGLELRDTQTPRPNRNKGGRMPDLLVAPSEGGKTGLRRQDWVEASRLV